MNIRKKFIVFSILWGIIPVIISTSICISNFKAKNIEIVKQNVETLANDQSMHLRSFFYQNINELSSSSQNPVVRDLLINSNNDKRSENNEKALNEIFKSKKSTQIYVSTELLINKNGIIASSSDDTDINKRMILSDDEISRLAHNQVVVTDIIQREDFNDGIKSAIIARPIFFEDEYQGAMISVINMNYFQELVNHVHFFETGKILIMDKKGVVAASSSEVVKDSINKINVPSDLAEKLGGIDLNENPQGIIEYKINGVEKIGYYSEISNTNWMVISGVEWNELKTPIEKSIQNMVIFIVFILLLVITSYIFIINYFSKPLYKLLDVIRKVKQGDLKDRFIYNKNNEFGEIATAFNDLIDTIEKNKKYIEEKNKNLQSLTSNIPGGVYRWKVENGEYFLDFVSSGFLNILGYKRNEFKEFANRNIFDVVYHKDKKRTASEMKEQLEKDNRYNVEYRVKRKNGEIIWLLDKGQIVKNRDGKSFSYSVVIDITQSKIMQEELRINEERYAIIMSQTEDIIFEWNIYKDTIYFSENWKNKFNYEPITLDISKNIYKSNNIHSEDIKKLGKILNEMINGKTYRETEIRIKKNTNEYIWCKIRITAMFDGNGNIFKAIGVIIDIDKEKKESEELLHKAQRDSLTGLYNKGTTQNLIEEYIENADEKTVGALFVIDLDNFKAVNDNLGHLSGDIVLSNISSMISEIFDEDSIIGRIGGDEFIIFLKDINSEELIRDKAEALIMGFGKKSNKDMSNYNVSGSIGIAKYPEHGKSFKELFMCADKATYLAKSKGKDNYCIFDGV